VGDPGGLCTVDRGGVDGGKSLSSESFEFFDSCTSASLESCDGELLLRVAGVDPFVFLSRWERGGSEALEADDMGDIVLSSSRREGGGDCLEGASDPSFFRSRAGVGGADESSAAGVDTVLP